MCFYTSCMLIFIARYIVLSSLSNGFPGTKFEILCVHVAYLHSIVTPDPAQPDCLIVLIQLFLRDCGNFKKLKLYICLVDVSCINLIEHVQKQNNIYYRRLCCLTSTVDFVEEHGRKWQQHHITITVNCLETDLFNL